jgi:23S rRNA pseudouridine2605 synthase
MRLQKYLADCGVASRRKSEEFITQGRVRVNGETVTQMGSTVEPGKDTVTFDGKKVSPEKLKVYIMLNKPAGVVSTCSDDKGRPAVLEFVSDVKERLYPVGRLDFTTEGLLLMTNDGRLANVLTHPKHNVEKKYLAVIDAMITDEEIKNLEGGVLIDGYRTGRAIFRVLNKGETRTEILCVITEGKNRQLRRMFEAVSKNVVYLKRVGVGEIKLGNLKKGAYRRLTVEEIDYLNKLAGS